MHNYSVIRVTKKNKNTHKDGPYANHDMRNYTVLCITKPKNEVNKDNWIRSKPSFA